MAGKKVVLPKGMDKINFMRLSKKEPHGRTKIRLLGLGHLAAGKSIEEVSQLLMVDRSSVRHWLDRFIEAGVEGLAEKPRSGRTQLLSNDKAEEVRCAIETLQASREGGRVRGVDIQELLAKKFNAVYDIDSVYKVLKRLNMVWISARSKHPKQSETVQETFKKTSLKKLKN